MLQAQSSAPIAATSALAMKARLRPIRCINSEAGKEVTAKPRMDIDKGSVAKAGSGAMRVPTIPPKETRMMVPHAAKAWARVKVQTCCMRQRRLSSLGVRRRDSEYIRSMPCVMLPRMTDETTRGQAPLPAPQPAFFENPVIDNLIAVTLELGAELWVQRERMRIIERLLAEKGVVTPELIEQYAPSPDEIERNRAERDAFVQRVFGIFGREMVRATPDS